MASLRSCFFVTPIGKPGSEQRRRSDWVLMNVIGPALSGLGYRDPINAVMSQNPDNIWLSIEKHLLDDLVFADLTGNAFNVGYEVLLRQLAGKPLILLIDTVEARIPSDIDKERVVYYHLMDNDAAKAAQCHIKERLSEIAKGNNYHIPISVATRESIVRALQESMVLELCSTSRAVSGMLDYSQSLAMKLEDLRRLRYGKSKLQVDISASPSTVGPSDLHGTEPITGSDQLGPTKTRNE